MTLFSISQAIRNAGGTVWFIDFDQPGAVVFRAEFGRQQVRFVKKKFGSENDEVPPEATPTHVVCDETRLQNFLKTITKMPVILPDYGHSKR